MQNGTKTALLNNRNLGSVVVESPGQSVRSSGFKQKKNPPHKELSQFIMKYVESKHSQININSTDESECSSVGEVLL